nr:thiamine phosphate synthase [Bacteroidota bacterium]
VESYSHDRLAELACLGGANWVQLRVKNKSYNEWLEIAVKTEAICRKYHAKIIINDNITLAKAIRADGVHLGKEDMSPKEARDILGKGFIIGGTANTFEDIERLASFEVDYIGLGPFRFTSTKENLSPVLGIEGYKEIIKNCNEKGICIPIIAIGGIKTEDVKTIMDKGVHGIAVSSAINLSENKMEATKRFLNKIKFAKNSLT